MSLHLLCPSSNIVSTFSVHETFVWGGHCGLCQMQRPRSTLYRCRPDICKRGIYGGMWYFHYPLNKPWPEYQTVTPVTTWAARGPSGVPINVSITISHQLFHVGPNRLDIRPGCLFPRAGSTSSCFKALRYVQSTEFRLYLITYLRVCRILSI